MEEEILHLARNLRQEEVFVRQERDLIERLHRDLVEVRYRELIQQLFVLLTERWFVEDVFTLAPEAVAAPDAAGANGASPCARFLELGGARFVESRCAGLDYALELGYADFLEKLRQRPVLVGQLLTLCEEGGGGQALGALARTVFGSLYAGCLTGEDEQSVLHLLKYLVDVQVAMHDNPRRLLQKEHCAFSRLLALYVEHLPAAKVYLTSALYQPLVRLLMEDTWFYDMDEQVMMSRFRPERAASIFGPPGTDEHRRRKERYKENTFQKLAQLADNFVQSLRATASAFPPTLLWLLGQLSCLVTSAGRVDRSEVGRICADVIFSRFISPAICEPEKFGIAADLAVSRIARYNLMQISKVIQVLSSMDGLGQAPEPRDLFGRFEPSCLTSLTGCLLEVAEAMAAGPPPVNPLSLASATASVAGGAGGTLVSRTVAPVTRQGLGLLVDTVRQYAERLPAGCADRTLIDAMVTGLPREVPDSRHSRPPAVPHMPPGDSITSPRPKLKFPSLGGGSRTSRSSSSPVGSLRSVAVGESLSTRSCSPEVDGGADAESLGGRSDPGAPGAWPGPQEVLLLALDPANAVVGGAPDLGCLLLPEGKVLEAQAAVAAGRKSTRVSIQHAAEAAAADHMQASGAEKRTRFSLSHDQESVGTTSDYLEGVSEVAASEVASYHSAASYESQEDEGDGLSDMISANVSGRGTPSISGGRDSPLSGGDLPPAGPPVVVHKPPPDVTEKFGKFDIPPACKARPNETESRSVVSDTWSTDVQGSADSEANVQDRLEEIAEEMVREESVSEDHWSVDALCDNEDKASERMADFDMDELDELSGAGSTSASQSDLGPSSSSTVAGAGSAAGRRRTGARRPGPGAGGGDSGDESSRLFVQPAPPGRPHSARAAPVAPETLDDLEVIRHHQQQQRQARARPPAPARPSAPPPPPPGPQQAAAAAAAKKSRGIQWLRWDGQAAPGPPGPAQQQQSVECESNAESVASEPAWGSLPPGGRGPAPRKGGTSEAGETGRKARSGSLRDRMKDKMNNNNNNNNNNSSSKGPVCAPARAHAEEGAGPGSDEAAGLDWTPDEASGGSRRASKGTGAGDGDIPFYDPSNLEKCQAFLDAKRKLRIVLSSSGNWGSGLNLTGSFLPSTPQPALPPHQPFANLINLTSTGGGGASSSSSCSSSSAGGRRQGVNGGGGGGGGGGGNSANALVRSLRLQIAHAINMQETERLARLQETLRIVRLFDNKGCLRLLASMERDWRLRQAYVAYLTRTRQHLCLQREEVDAAARRVACDRRICARVLNRLCVERFLAAFEREVADFHSRFSRPPRDAMDRHNTEDVKRELMEGILNRLFREMENYPLWRGASAAQLEEARTYLERMLFSRVYYEAMFLNDYEADKQRDELLHRELEILSEAVTENHPDIAISRQFHCVVPFQHAQEELRMINVYKTPAEKVRCIVRTANVIGSLLMLSCDGQASGADEIFPVLLYVLIKVNPPMLKATIQFVETFYEHRFVNYEYYWWTTFKAVVNQTTRMLAVAATPAPAPEAPSSGAGLAPGPSAVASTE